AVPRDAVRCVGGYWQPKYSVPNARMVEAVQLLARTEAILLDPVYTGKAMAGLIGMSRDGTFGRGDKVLFVHTRGAPALHADERGLVVGCASERRALHWAAPRLRDLHAPSPRPHGGRRSPALRPRARAGAARRHRRHRLLGERVRRRDAAERHGLRDARLP